jgi:hypothetical protein
VERAGADLHVIGLQDHAALLRPEMLQREYQILKRVLGIESGRHGEPRRQLASLNLKTQFQCACKYQVYWAFSSYHNSSFPGWSHDNSILQLLDTDSEREAKRQADFDAIAFTCDLPH